MSKECNGNHSNEAVRYCVKCGKELNPNAPVVPNCKQYHQERKKWGYNYCPDCQQKL